MNESIRHRFEGWSECWVRRILVQRRGAVDDFFQCFPSAPSEDAGSEEFPLSSLIVDVRGLQVAESQGPALVYERWFGFDGTIDDALALYRHENHHPWPTFTDRWALRDERSVIEQDEVAVRPGPGDGEPRDYLTPVRASWIAASPTVFAPQRGIEEVRVWGVNGFRWFMAGDAQVVECLSLAPGNVYNNTEACFTALRHHAHVIAEQRGLTVLPWIQGQDNEVSSPSSGDVMFRSRWRNPGTIDAYRSLLNL